MTAQKITILTVATLILSVAGAAASEQAEVGETPVAQALDAVLDVEIEQPSKLESQERELDQQLARFPWEDDRRRCRKGDTDCQGGSQQLARFPWEDDRRRCRKGDADCQGGSQQLAA